MSNLKLSIPMPSITTMRNISIEKLLDQWSLEGGLDLNEVKTKTLSADGLANLCYGFFTGSGFSVRAQSYWVNEDRKFREYFWAEVALSNINKILPNENIHLFFLSLSQDFPSPYKLTVSNDLIMLTIRFACDGLEPFYVQELIEGLLPAAQFTFEKFSEKAKGILTLVDQIKKDEIEDTNLH